ncbi:MAG: hypothetical protein OXM56_04430, partial [Gammaproteobacteria bacterium]|nr:hypothetical protein [Gammaproteobacteria bacterium]
GGAVNDQVATLNFLYCDPDIDQAARIGVPMLGAFNVANAHLLFTREAYPTRAYGLLANLAPGRRGRRSAEDNPGARAGIPEGMAIGDPQHLVRVMKEWESLGVDQVNFLLNAMEMIPQEKVLASLRLFASEVMPQFRREAA